MLKHKQVIAGVYGRAGLKLMRERRSRLQRALGGLGEHGMIEVETSLIDSEHVESELLPLPVAFRVELDRMADNCKISMAKLTRAARNVSFDDHRRQMSPSSAKKFNILANMDHRRSTGGAVTAVDKGSFAVEYLECNHQRMLNFTSQSIQVQARAREVSLT